MKKYKIEWGLLIATVILGYALLFIFLVLVLNLFGGAEYLAVDLLRIFPRLTTQLP